MTHSDRQKQRAEIYKQIDEDYPKSALEGAILKEAAQTAKDKTSKNQS